ncbi:histidine phosphatase family protein [Pontibacillus salicampi]|uniref:Histidine phosphatase family protein n=1 Tax=Pontibacillus salicampi TaxID=1449801 RepID=A0ABV6LK79_9BACI
MDRTVDLYLIRHSITAANKEKRYLGWTDVPLLDEGKRELCFILPSLPDKCDRVYSSDLQRCVETAFLLFPNCSVYQTSQLREIHFGDWELCTFQEVEHRSDYNEWLQSPDSFHPNNGESYEAFRLRVSEWLKALLHLLSCEEKIVSTAVITHGGPLREIIYRLHSSSSSPWEWHCQPGEGYKLTITKKEDDKWILLQVESIMAKGSG